VESRLWLGHLINKHFKTFPKKKNPMLLFKAKGLLSSFLRFPLTVQLIGSWRMFLKLTTLRKEDSSKVE